MMVVQNPMVKELLRDVSCDGLETAMVNSRVPIIAAIITVKRFSVFCIFKFQNEQCSFGI